MELMNQVLVVAIVPVGALLNADERYTREKKITWNRLDLVNVRMHFNKGCSVFCWTFE